MTQLDESSDQLQRVAGVDDVRPPLAEQTVGAVTVHYCDEEYLVEPGSQFTIGRDADLSVDDNQFLHRVFLALSDRDGFWFLHNVGSQLGATVSNTSGHLEAFLAPGASIPLVFSRTLVAFSAGPTIYEVEFVTESQAFSVPTITQSENGDTTIGPVRFTTDQRILIVALAEPRLRRDGRVAISLPSSPEAARRLGWTNSKFNRKLDNVCDKLTKLGVRGLHGDISSYASNRRARLVEYAVATRLVTVDDLAVLDQYCEQAAAEVEVSLL